MQYYKLKEMASRLSPFVVGTEGNISARTEDGFVIKASGKSFKDIDFVYCDKMGVPLPNQKGKPSMEVSFHTWIYQNSDFNFIAHTHPTNTLKILCTDWIYSFYHERLFPDQVVFNGEYACVVPYATPGTSLTEKISDVVTANESFSNLFLLQNHGIICCGNSIEEVVAMTEICEKAAEVFIGVKAIGYPITLTTEQIREIQEHDGEIYRHDSIRGH